MVLTGGQEMNQSTSGVARRGLAMVWMTVGSLWLCGCGASIESYCEDICDCVGCSAPDLDECIEGGEEFAAEAEDHGCADEWDEYLDCSVDTLECEDGEAIFDESCEDILDDCES